jgi:hypothetical protein
MLRTHVVLFCFNVQYFLSSIFLFLMFSIFSSVLVFSIRVLCPVLFCNTPCYGNSNESH